MPTSVAQQPTRTAKRALLNLNMGIAHTYEIATQIVGMQLSGKEGSMNILEMLLNILRWVGGFLWKVLLVVLAAISGAVFGYVFHSIGLMSPRDGALLCGVIGIGVALMLMLFLRG